MKVHYPKLYNIANLLASNILLLPKDLAFVLSKKSQIYKTLVRK